MLAKKGNRSYAITEAQKASYLKQGFDIHDDDGKVVAYGVGKTVPYEKYAAVVRELEELKNGVTKKELDDMDADELKAYADQNGIDIGKATSVEGILTKIKETEKES